MTNKTDTLTDKHLVEKVLSGNTDAFAAIVKNTEGLVAQIVFKMIALAEDRKDIVQDIYLKAYKNLSGFRFGSKLSTWIAQIAYNTCTDHLRKKKLVLVRDLYQNDGSEVPDSGHLAGSSAFKNKFSEDKQIFQKELSEILRSEMEKLSPVFRTMISLYHNEDLTYEEIGHITGLPEGTVKSYLFRARKTLKNNLLRSYKKEEL